LLAVSVAAGDLGPVLVLAGEADITSVDLLNRALADQLSRGTRYLTVDLSGLGFMDSASLRELVLAARALKDRGGDLELVHPQPVVARMLELHGVAEWITVRDGASSATGLEDN
jgi:stage II sporulation protein AA (anti-sigma F factor antagonist)